MNDSGDRDGAVRVWEERLKVNPVAMFNGSQRLEPVVAHCKEGHDKTNPIDAGMRVVPL